MEDIHEKPEELLEEYLNRWLDLMMEVYGDILQEWDENDIVQPFENAQVEFSCNNCGKCCEFDDHWVWVYPPDIISWINKIKDVKYAPLLLGILFPVQDMEDNIGYGLPSQKSLFEKFRIFAKKNKKIPHIRDTLLFILEKVREMNPSFDTKSEYCIFYDSNEENHCIIHENRPIQCKSYPYDYPQFTKIMIPPELEDKYGKIEEDLEDLPECPKETFSGNPIEGIKINEKQIKTVIMEKSNYLTSTITQQCHEEDISEILIELFHKDILNMERNKKFVKDRRGEESKFIAGKRPTKN